MEASNKALGLRVFVLCVICSVIIKLITPVRHTARYLNRVYP